MIKHIEITEVREDGTLGRKLASTDTDTLVIATDGDIHVSGIDNQLKAIRLFDQILSALIEYTLGVDALDDEPVEIVREVVCLKSIMAANLASVNIGYSGDIGMFATEADDEEAKIIAGGIIDYAMRIARLSDNIQVTTTDKAREMIGRKLMEELEELEDNEK